MESTERKPDDDLISQITGYMRVGADYKLATAACGISESLADKWWKSAQDANKIMEEGIYLRLYEAIRTSIAQAEVIALQRLSAEGGAAGARHVLAIINPGKYGKSSKQKSMDELADDANDWFSQTLTTK